jgi:hypothetical protein
MTWNEIYKAADGAGYGDEELRTKDEARYQVRCLAMEFGAPDLEGEECPEDWVEGYCEAMEIRFNKHGNIVDLRLPTWVENVVYHRKENEYISEDLRRTVCELYDGVDISDDQMEQMLKRYWKIESSNNAQNDTLEYVVKTILEQK